MTGKWLNRLTKDQENIPMEGEETPKEKEKEQEGEMQPKYTNLTLRMANAIMDMSRALIHPTSQVEGDEELERGMKKARVGPPDSSIYTKHHGEIGLLERQHHL